MSPSMTPRPTSFGGFPRVSGDEPATYTGDMRAALFSPRERG